MNKDGQMKKGALEMSILYCVSLEDNYGYEIMKRVSSAFSGTDESTVYAILRRLLANEQIECYQKGVPSLGPVRKYYRITKAGAEHLEAAIKSWRDVCVSVNKIGI